MQTIRQIVIDFIPHRQQRYRTVGDWFFDGDVLRINASATPDERHQQLVAVHELVEALTCNVDGVTQEAVDAFDMGAGAALAEPGDSADAPYHEQHNVAHQVEGEVLAAMHVHWDEYEAALDALGK